MELKYDLGIDFTCKGVLLIVPYGIEMSFADNSINIKFTFNRTLWNWNDHFGYYFPGVFRLLIVPYGIEIEQ